MPHGGTFSHTKMPQGKGHNLLEDGIGLQADSDHVHHPRAHHATHYLRNHHDIQVSTRQRSSPGEDKTGPDTGDHKYGLRKTGTCALMEGAPGDWVDIDPDINTEYTNDPQSTLHFDNDGDQSPQYVEEDSEDTGKVNVDSNSVRVRAVNFEYVGVQSAPVSGSACRQELLDILNFEIEIPKSHVEERGLKYWQEQVRTVYSHWAVRTMFAVLIMASFICDVCETQVCN
jgi:hypothetical protein